MNHPSTPDSSDPELRAASYAFDTMSYKQRQEYLAELIERHRQAAVDKLLDELERELDESKLRFFGYQSTGGGAVTEGTFEAVGISRIEQLLNSKRTGESGK